VRLNEDGVGTATGEAVNSFFLHLFLHCWVRPGNDIILSRVLVYIKLGVVGHIMTHEILSPVVDRHDAGRGTDEHV